VLHKHIVKAPGKRGHGESGGGSFGPAVGRGGETLCGGRKFQEKGPPLMQAYLHCLGGRPGKKKRQIALENVVRQPFRRCINANVAIEATKSGASGPVRHRVVNDMRSCGGDLGLGSRTCPSPRYRTTWGVTNFGAVVDDFKVSGRGVIGKGGRPISSEVLIFWENK